MTSVALTGKTCKSCGEESVATSSVPVVGVGVCSTTLIITTLCTPCVT